MHSSVVDGQECGKNGAFLQHSGSGDDTRDRPTLLADPSLADAIAQIRQTRG